MGDDYIVVGGLCSLPLSKTQPIPGSKRRKCGKCGREVWLSPASLRIVKNHRAGILCTDCYPKGEPGYMMREQAEELRDYLLNRNRN